MARTAPPSPTERASQSNGVSDKAGENDSGSQESVQEAIARRAYGFWLERQGGNEGSAEEDWFRAERELRARQSSPR